MWRRACRRHPGVHWRDRRLGASLHRPHGRRHHPVPWPEAKTTKALNLKAFASRILKPQHLDPNNINPSTTRSQCFQSSRSFSTNSFVYDSNCARPTPRKNPKPCNSTRVVQGLGDKSIRALRQTTGPTLTPEPPRLQDSWN